MLMDEYFDFVIIGSGMVGLATASQLKSRLGENLRVAVIEKESSAGCHSSGRSSGVLHAGIYYEPNSIKAKVCIGGKNRLTQWVKERNLSYNQCGKLIVAQEERLDGQLDLLASRGIANGANVELLDIKDIKKIAPKAFSSTNRALWSP